MKPLNFKPLNFLLISILLLGGLFWAGTTIELRGMSLWQAMRAQIGSSDLIQGPPLDKGVADDFPVKPLIIDGVSVAFPHTDDNSGETLIIKSDKKTYTGLASSDAYFSVTNTGDSDEDGVLLFYFNKSHGEVRALAQWDGQQWQPLTIFKQNIKVNTKVLKTAWEKRSTIPDDFEVRAGAQYAVPAGQTVYFKSMIAYPTQVAGEFWVETLGTQGGYGLLDPWYASTYSYRKRFVIDRTKVSGASNLSNFPTLVSFTSADLKTTANGGKAASGSGEFVVTSADGTTVLDHEIESYTATTGNLVVWVEVPTLSVTSDTILYIYYGGPSSGATNQNKTGVWDANYKAVYHLKEDPTVACSGTAEACESTSLANHMDAVAMEAGDQTAGQIDGSLTFDGTGEYLERASDADFTPDTEWTLSAWIKVTADTTNIILSRQNNGDGWQMFYDDVDNNINCDTGNLGNLGSTSSVNSITLNSWHYIACVWDESPSLGQAYINGTANGTPNTTGTVIGNEADIIRIAAKGDAGASFKFPGTIDEVRVSSVVRSSDWIKTEYNNQSSPSTFMAVGKQEARVRTTAGVKYGTGTASGATWYASTYSYRKRFVIDRTKVSGTANLSNFPTLISLTDADLKTTANGGKAASGSGEFVFTSANGTTTIDHEIESYTATNGNLIAWVEVPTLSVSSDTIIYLYYGGPSSGATNQNKTGTWDANYKGVWHLKEDPTTNSCGGSNDNCDSTSNANHGAATNMEAGDQLAGQINGSLDFDGTNENISMGDPASLDFGTTSFSFGVWFKDLSGGGQNLVNKRDTSASTTAGYHIISEGTGQQRARINDSAGNSALTSIWSGTNDAKWHYVMIVVDRTPQTIKIYGDGVQQGANVSTSAVGSVSNAVAFKLGSSANDAGFYNGTLDEARVSGVVLSSDWIKTEYNNQSSPSTFYAVGAREARITSTVKVGKTGTLSGASWYLSTYSYRKRFVIDRTKVSGTADLSNFPMLISLTDADLKTTANGGKAASGSGEFVFTSSDGTTTLDHEIESYTATNGNLIAWVEVPTLSVSSDTVLYIYYGGPSSGATNQNKTGTWDTNYKGVWHLGNGTTLSAFESKNGNTGTITSATAVAAGKVNGAGDFNANAYINAGTSIDISALPFTVSVWVNPDDFGDFGGLISKRDSFAGNQMRFSFYLDLTDGSVVLQSFDVTTDSGTTVPAIGAWNYLTVVARSGATDFYLNGTFQTTNTAFPFTLSTGSGAAVFLGSNDSTGDRLDGKLDEARISSSARSSDWIKTEYNNQFSPSTFAAFGKQEARLPSAPPVKLK